MGNLAVKCESQLQERKAMANSVGRSTVDVRVMKADGTGVEEFERPVLVVEVMCQFPDCVVVQWCPWRNSKLGKRGQLRVLQRHEVLTRGQIYLLFPIPAEVAQKARRCRRTQNSKDKLSLLLQRADKATMETEEFPEKKQQSLRNEKPSEDEKSEIHPPAFPGFNVGGWAPVVPNLTEESRAFVEKGTSENQEDRTSQKPNLSLQPLFNGTWRPALLSIPESPLGFHSRPESPRTPAIAFRLVSSRKLER